MEVKKLFERFPVLEGNYGEETVETISDGRSVIRGYVRHEHGMDVELRPYGTVDEEVRNGYIERAKEVYPEFDEDTILRIAEQTYCEEMKKRIAGLSINLSSSYSVLIKEAAECVSYASDVLIDVVLIQDVLSQRTDGSCTFWFGFRRCGVDHDVFIANRIGDGTDREIAAEYRCIYRLDIERSGADISTALAKVWDIKCLGGDHS